MTVKEACKLVSSRYIFPIKCELEKLLTDDFVSSHTPYKNADDFFSSSDIEFNGQEEFDSLDVSKLNDWVSANSKFKSWVDFLQAAYDFYLRQA